MPVQLTESAITKGLKAAALNGRRSDLADAGCPGLRLRVAPSGAASWALCCRDREGRMRRYQLGAWPAVGVSKARDAARALHVEVRQRGADPVKDGREARAKARNVAEGIGTLAALLDHYGSMRGAELRSWPDCKRQISNVFRAHMKRPLASLTRATLQTTADKHRSKQAAAAAIRYIKPIFGWAAERSLLDGALASIKPPAKVLQRDRVLTDAELAAIWRATDAKGIPLTFASLVKLLILTGQRREEITAMEWPELSADRATWTIPRARVKGDRPHVVPMCEAARAILPPERDGGAAGLVFPGQRGTPFSGFSKAKTALDTASGVSGWRIHDIRRTVATGMQRMGVRLEVTEAVLGHTSGSRAGVVGIYQRHDWLDEKRVTLEAWAAHVAGVVRSQTEAKPAD